MSDIDESLLADYALGNLGADEARAVERALSASPDLQRQLLAIDDGFFGLVASLPRTSPPSSVRSSILAAIAAERHLPFANDVARYCDLGLARVREILRWVDDQVRWNDGPMPGIRVLDFDGGPNMMAADCGLVRLAAGLRFPKHRHLGNEVNYILDGKLIDSDGKVYGPGDALEKTAKDVHSFTIGSEQDCVLLVVQDGFEILPPE